ncbi:ATP-binding protein [Streptomyces sp. CS159]|uniref:ATP-binding protein n=1 Tax=Streptomyces sp. CS159 TaxID=1982762 RepID=UPI000B40941F|nr:ATP-binding protein [Streptomyces sp. CS159]OWA01152.1 ATP-binding protein [Streptomyces sp. CS159]
MTAPARTGDRPSPRALAAVALPCAVVAALVVGGAVAAAPSSVRLPLGLGAGAAAILLTAALTAAVHAVRAERATRRLLAAARADADAGRARAVAEADRERDALTAEFARERERLTEDFEQERARLAGQRAAETARLAEESARLGARLKHAAAERAAAVSATANAAGRMQALATGMLADLRAMEERHSDEEVLADLLHLDHRTAQAGRIADSVAVLTGARSGRRWARPIGMESILRGAMGRIAGYQRVRVHSTSDSAVAGHAAEGVMHALAELLDNAANFSPPTAEVHVYVEEVPAGVIVSVEDSGLVMGEVQLRRAQQAVAGETTGLGGLTGTRLGLAVVGRLSAKYGLKVSFRPSARGGTGVLMLVPQDILSGPAVSDAPGTAPAVPTAPTVQAGRAGQGPASAPSTPEAGAEPPLAEVDREPPPVHHHADREQDGIRDRDRNRDGEREGVQGRDALQAPGGDQDQDRDQDQDPHRNPNRGQDQDGHQNPNRDQNPDPHQNPAAQDRAAVELPKRRRGRTLAAAERARAAARAAEPRPAPSAEDAKARAARFSSFRQAVRNTTGAAPEPAETAPDHPSHSPAHPEGDTTP